MPWTFAHAAAVIPFKKVLPKRLYFLALIVGSIVPDFGYYIGQTSLSHFSHTIAGLFLACLPIGLMLTYGLARSSKFFAIILPKPHSFAYLRVMNAEKIDSLKSMLCLFFGVLLGSLTHILWDSFTHASGWVVAHSDLLKTEVINIGTLKIYGFSVLQYLSSIVGTAILLFFYVKWLNKNNLTFFSTEYPDRWRYTLIGGLGVICLLISLPIAYFHTRHLPGALAIGALVVDLAFLFTSVFFVSVIIAIFYIKSSRKSNIN